MPREGRRCASAASPPPSKVGGRSCQEASEELVCTGDGLPERLDLRGGVIGQSLAEATEAMEVPSSERRRREKIPLALAGQLRPELRPDLVCSRGLLGALCRFVSDQQRCYRFEFQRVGSVIMAQVLRQKHKRITVV